MFFTFVLVFLTVETIVPMAYCTVPWYLALLLALRGYLTELRIMGRVDSRLDYNVFCRK